MDVKSKSENIHAKKSSFLNGGGENGAMLTTYLFIYTSECTISWVKIFKIVFDSGG